MNILIFLNDDNYVGGAEGVLRQIGEYYLERGHRLYVLFLRPKKYGGWNSLGEKGGILLFGGIVKLSSVIIKLRHIRFNFSYTSIVDFTSLLGVLRRLHILQIDCMVGRESTMIFERFNGIKLLRKKLMYSVGYPAVDILICQTEKMKEGILENLPWLSKYSNIVVIPNPVSMDSMVEKGNAPLNVANYHPYIISAGRFIYEKGFDVLIKAFSELKQEKVNLKLVILGDGPLRGVLEQLIKEQNLCNSVFLPGFAENVYPWFKKAEMCVLSSRKEGFPNVLLQMMSQNKKVVSTLCAGDINTIKGIYTCEPDSLEGLRKAMADCLKGNISGEEELFEQELRGRSIKRYIKVVESIKS